MTGHGRGWQVREEPYAASTERPGFALGLTKSSVSAADSWWIYDLVRETTGFQRRPERTRRTAPRKYLRGARDDG